MMLPAFTKALHPDDYQSPFIRPHFDKLREFQREIDKKGCPKRKDHEHRDWEYASLLAMMEALHLPKSTTIHDTGSGGSFMPLYLASEGYSVSVSDSMAYGDIEPMLQEQCIKLGLSIPMHKAAVEELTAEKHGQYDLTICVSTIEHVGAELFDEALRGLVRITKPGGLIYLTSDYFQNEEQGEKSPFRSIQHTLFTETLVLDIPSRIPVNFVGGTDLTYMGDFVWNYSFVRMLLRKRVEEVTWSAIKDSIGRKVSGDPEESK